MLILLDIDGVMVPATSWRPTEILSDGFANFSSRAVSNLQNIIYNTGARILLTTSHKSKFSNSEWEIIFKNRGIIANITALEPNLDNLNRKEEILRWCNKTNSSESFVILDDDKTLNGLPDYIKNKAIITSGTVGLTTDQALEAIDILRKEEFAVI
ncbi:HAD domain-containing protein [Flavobacterium luteolum]|uniref:HAD domain-containing protein n=1 Tax=Flavobacterium luteolum TaxID=3003259 RepID=UPI00248F184A|nr:HAD domain-containing protein [Flavobacterium luteolum]